MGFNSRVGRFIVLVVELVAIAIAVVVWCGVVWCGVVWCGVVWCGVDCCSFILSWCAVVISLGLNDHGRVWAVDAARKTQAVFSSW